MPDFTEWKKNQGFKYNLSDVLQKRPRNLHQIWKNSSHAEKSAMSKRGSCNVQEGDLTLVR